MRATQAGAALLLILSAACSEEPDTALPELPWDRAPFPDAQAPDDARAALGRLLFYDPILSRDRAVACSTCHSELWGLGDGLALSVGVDGVGPAGPGRHGPNVTTRNSPTLWNVAFRTELFWDGRASTLEAQALLPIENEVEMGREVVELIDELRTVAGYRTLFAEAFDEAEPITAENVARALADFQRTFITKLAPYDRYARGDRGALKPQAIEGLFLFERAGCATCHTPPLFQSMTYADRGIGDDPGRFEVTGDEADRHVFRTPTLRNLRETGPYFHDGSVITLEDAVDHEATRSEMALTREEIAAIAFFIRKGLMDRSLEPDRPEEVPSGLEVPRDGSRIPR